MRIVFLGNNQLAWWVSRWLQERNENIVAMVLHPPERRRFGEELLSTLPPEGCQVFGARDLNDQATLDAIRSLDPDIGISILFGYLMRPELLDLFPNGCVNLHPSFLPYNRGAYPNVWSIIDGTPAGVTLHYVDEGVDTGDIVAQSRVEVTSIDTGRSLFGKLESAAFELFRSTWPLLRDGRAPRVPQDLDAGTQHRVADVDLIDEIDLDRSYTARDLINLLRARTFPPYTGAYFRVGSEKVYPRIELSSQRDPES